jgi:phage-related protein
MNKKYRIGFYKSSRVSPVVKFIENDISVVSHAKSAKVFALVEEYGPAIGEPHIKKVAKRLFEIRIKGKEQIRYLFCIFDLNIIILHGFKKKKNKIDKDDIDLANNRLKNI